MSDLLKSLKAFENALAANAAASGVDLPDNVGSALKVLELASKEVKEKLEQIEAEAEAQAKADAEAKAQAKAEAEADADAFFVQYLNDNNFVAFAGKGGKIACLLDSKLDRAASQEANIKFGLLQCQAEGCSFSAEKFTSRLVNLEISSENRYLLQVHLNLPKSKNIKLNSFGGYEVKYYFTK